MHRPIRVPRWALAVACLAMAALPAAAQVYKWTGPDGRTHYGDHPPDEAKKQELRIGVQSFGGPAEVDTWTKVLKRPPAVDTSKPRSAAVTMFSTSWCPHCKRAKAYFARKGVGYREVDIEASDAGRREFQQYGGSGVPLIIVGEQRMRGFDAGAMDRMLASAAP
ncbi:MAG: glutaredoxin family protein [Betaproteobacteria bacterium]|nr:glutaredoxin family protein [Betaproteobacteria bacterium]